jgi:hypothetical protein
VVYRKALEMINNALPTPVKSIEDNWVQFANEVIGHIKHSVRTIENEK